MAGGRRGQRRHVPGPADHRDGAVPFAGRGPDWPGACTPRGAVHRTGPVRRPPGRRPQRRHRLGHGGERLERVAAEPVLDDVLPPPFRIVVGRPPATASPGVRRDRRRRANGRRPGCPWPGLRPSTARTAPARRAVRRGRSMNLASRSPPRRRPAIACHSGENSANGQNAASPGRPRRAPRSATGGTRPGSCPADSGSASGGPSIRTRSGSGRPARARTARAEPGPWCRTPRIVTLTRSSRRRSRQARYRSRQSVALPDHGLQVLVPDHPVLQRGP